MELLDFAFPRIPGTIPIIDPTRQDKHACISRLASATLNPAVDRDELGIVPIFPCDREAM